MPLGHNPSFPGRHVGYFPILPGPLLTSSAITAHPPARLGGSRSIPDGVGATSSPHR